MELQTRIHTHPSTACLGENRIKLCAHTVLHVVRGRMQWHSLALILSPAQTLLASCSRLASRETLRQSTVY